MSRLVIQSFYQGVEYDERGQAQPSCLVVVTNGSTEMPVEVDEESFNNLMQLALGDQAPVEELPPQEPVLMQTPLREAPQGFTRTRPAPAGDFDSSPAELLQHDENIDPGELHTVFDETADGTEQI
jgi:hypothetical protein